MNDVGKFLLWQKLRNKTNKGEDITLSDVVWGFLTQGGQVPKNELVVDGSQVLIKRMEEYKAITDKTDKELESFYLEQKAANEKNVKETKEFFKKFQDQCKRIKTELNKKKIPAETKEAIIGTLRGFLENLNREIIDESKFPPYDEWKKDTLNVATSQPAWVKDRIKQAKKEYEKNMKWLAKIEEEVPYIAEKGENDTNKVESESPVA